MKREKLRKPSNSVQEYKEDNTIGNEQNPLTKLLGVSSMFVGGVLAYKKGAFRGVSSKVLEAADLYRMNSLNIVPTVKTFNRWANMHKLEAEYADSIVRNNLWSSIKKLKNTQSRESIISDTKSDVSDLIFKVRERIEYKNKTKNFDSMSYMNTELMHEIGTINSFAGQLSKEKNGKAMAHRARMMMSNDLHSYMKLTKEQASSQIKKNGYRSVVLEDVMKVIDNGKGKKVIALKRSDFQFDDATKEKLESFMRETRISYLNPEGKRVRDQLINTDSWKDFRLDTGLMINKKGNLIDTRYASKYTKEFIRTLSNDYQVPGVNFNPLRLLGGDQVGIKKNRYGIIHQSTVQNALTGGIGKKTLKETGEYGNTPLLFINGNVYKFNDNKSATVTTVAKDMQVEKLSNRTSSYGIRSDLNAYRKMVGINTRDYNLYTKEDGTIKHFYSKIMKKLDIGFQDRDSVIKQTKTITTPKGNSKVVEVEQDEGILSINRFVENLRTKILDKLPKPYKDVTEKTKITNVFGSVDKEQDLFLLRHKNTSIKDVLKEKDGETLSTYFKGFYSGRKDPENINNKGIFVYSLADRLNQTLSGVGLGLGMDSIGSTSEIITNIAMKRVLPIYGVYQTMQYMTYLSERDDENKGNIQKDISEVFKAVNLGMHKLKDVTGLTTVIKRLTDLSPGSDNLTELPGVYNLGLDRSYEEQKEYYESGMDPVRKGRFWGLGNTPFTGSKISYWKPNAYRRIQGDVMFTDSKYGSRKEYFDNAWFSSPIKHFITDKYHYEEKHYDDRPYMLTTPEFENTPIIGDVLSATVGKAIKPQRRMHEEYWNTSIAEETSTNNEVAKGDIAINEKIGESLNTNGEVTEGINTVSVGPSPSRIKEGMTPVVYTTPSGQSSVYNIGENNVEDVRDKVKEESISRVDGIRQLDLTRQEKAVGQSTILNPNSTATTLASQYTNMTNLTGMTGYFTETFITGTPMENTDVYDTMGYSMSFNKSFWDQEIGGLGGAFSEIFRRFIPDKNKDYNYINPIKNTMPSWIPDDEYMIDFTSGDPYTKVKWGEGRLPGEGYEKLWGIDGNGKDFENYNTIDKVRILGDIAPWSDEYDTQSKLLRQELDEKENSLSKESGNYEAETNNIANQREELKAIEERISKQKEPLRVYDYKFKTANLIRKTGEIDKILDDGSFTLKGEEEGSYKFGGIDVHKGKTPEELDSYNEYMEKNFKEGDNITLKLDADELNRKPTGINDSVKTIVMNNGKNLNRDLVRNGFATLKEDDDSAIGVNVRHGAFDKMVGSVWERITHLDIFPFINTKALQVRSPLEHYKRNVVYGEDFQEWEKPIDNFLKPTVNKMIEHPLGLLIAPLIGAMIGRKKSSSLIGATLGFGAALFGKTVAKSKEIVTGEKWTPESRKKETDIDEYVDKLKYVKNMKLYKEYSEKSLEEDGFNVEEYKAREESEGQKRKKKSREIKQIKQDINYGKTDIREVAKENEQYQLTKEEKKEFKKQERATKLDIIKSAAKSMRYFKDNGKRLDILKNRVAEYLQVDDDIDVKEERAMTKKMNNEASGIENDRDIEQLPENAMMALQYYEKAQQTVYGYDQGESVQNLMKAIPKIERDYFKYFMKAPEEERDEIIQVLPGYLKNAMLGMWGKNTQKEALPEYFKDHQLPDENWLGWEENVNLDSVKVKMVEDADMEFSNFNIWDDDIKEADMQEIPIPYVNKRSNDNYVQAQLASILEENGYENVKVRSKPSLKNNVNMDIKNDARPYVSKKIKDGDFYE